MYMWLCVYRERKGQRSVLNKFYSVEIRRFPLWDFQILVILCVSCFHLLRSLVDYNPYAFDWLASLMIILMWFINFSSMALVMAVSYWQYYQLFSWSPAGAIRAGRNPATYRSHGETVHVKGKWTAINTSARYRQILGYACFLTFPVTPIYITYRVSGQITKEGVVIFNFDILALN